MGDEDQPITSITSIAKALTTSKQQQEVAETWNYVFQDSCYNTSSALEELIELLQLFECLNIPDINEVLQMSAKLKKPEPEPKKPGQNPFMSDDESEGIESDEPQVEIHILSQETLNRFCHHIQQLFLLQLTYYEFNHQLSSERDDSQLEVSMNIDSVKINQYQ